MKSSKSYYDIIGIAQDSSFEEIRNAYLIRSKMFHPDRFNHASQKEEWRLANEMLQELNVAYNTLREKESRRLYDLKIGINVSSGKQGSNSTPPDASSSKPVSSHSTPRTTTSGFCFYADLPEQIRKRFLNRILKKDKKQFIVSLNSVLKNYIFLAFFLGWFVIIFFLSQTVKWSSDARNWIFWISSIAGFFIGLNISWIIRWHKSLLGCHFIVTPIYYIHNYLDQIWYWPHYKLKNVEATHKYRNGNFVQTDATFVFDTGIEEITFKKKEDYEDILAASKVFEIEFENAAKVGDHLYETREDDFNGFKNSGLSKPRSSPSSTTIFCLICSVVGAAILSMLALSLNSSLKIKVYSGRSPANPQSVEGDAGPVLPKNLFSGGNSIASTNINPDVSRLFIFNEPILDTPPSGEVHRFNSEPGIAPLEINSSSGENYVVKLSDADSGQDVLFIFVRGGQSERVDVPLGNYIIKYASAKNGMATNIFLALRLTIAKRIKHSLFRETAMKLVALLLRFSKLKMAICIHLKFHRLNFNTSKVPPHSF